MTPIVLFVYNRPQETQRLLDTLLACPEAQESKLFVFSDGARHKSDLEKVEQVRALFNGIEGFKSITVYPCEVNKGLSKSVIQGVSHILEQYPHCIVLEDDLIVSKDFLSFMNHALVEYQDRKDIFSISGYTPPIHIPDDYAHDVFLVQRPQCWGWATWNDRWNTVDWDAKDATLLRKRKYRRSFDMGGNDLSRTMSIWQHGGFDVWAIRWVFACWRQQAWTVNPIVSKTSNGGLFDKATHGGWNDHRHDVSLSDRHIVIEQDIQPDNRICLEFKKHHDLGPISRLGYFMRRHNLGYKQVKYILNMMKRTQG